MKKLFITGALALTIAVLGCKGSSSGTQTNNATTDSTLTDSAAANGGGAAGGVGTPPPTNSSPGAGTRSTAGTADSTAEKK
jgi:hypothetical protein